MINTIKKYLSLGAILLSMTALYGDVTPTQTPEAPQVPPTTQAQIPTTAAETPYGLVYPKENPQLEFISFDIYDKEPVDQNVKATSNLPKSTTGFVYGMLTVKNLLHNVRDQDYKVTYKYLNDKGMVQGEFDSTFGVKKDWDYATYYSSWGWAEPKNWTLGNYTLELWIDGNKFAAKNFTITNE